MSPKSLDPLSQRKNDSAAAESTSPVPRGVDATRVLEKAQATVEARKEAQAKQKRRAIFWVLVVSLVVFIFGATFIGYRQFVATERDQYRNDQQKQIIEKLDALSLTKDMNDEQKRDLASRVGAKYLAAQAVGVAPSVDVLADKNTLNFVAGANATPEKAEKAISQLIDGKLKLVQENGYFEAYVFYYWYGNSLIAWPSSYVIPNRGNRQAYEADRTKALEQAQKDMADLKAHAVQPAQVVARLQSDRMLSPYEDPNGSSLITPSLAASVILDDTTSTILKVIYDFGKVGYSEIKTRNYISVHDSSKTPVEAAHYFVLVDKFIKGEAVLREYEKKYAEYKAKGI